MTSTGGSGDGFASRPAWSLSGATPPEPGEELTLPSTPEERFAARAEIGSGGMGRVRLFRDRWLGRLVAVKEPATEGDARRLWREALVTARLEHPGIVPLYDLGLGPGGTPWFAMRVVRGRSLAEILRAEPGPRPDLVRLLLAACEAVGYAHHEGVVHRDLKPANLMVGAFGEMQVIDWGLARAADIPDADVGSAGTLAYMSPEQARGEQVEPPSDVWSLGAVLFEITTGATARASASDEVMLASARRGETRPLPRGVPPELAAIIRRALAIEPTARYPDAKALAEELERYLDGRRVEAHRYSTLELLSRLVRAWRVPLVIAGISLVVLTVLLVAGFTRIREERDVAEANLATSLQREAQHALEDERLVDAQRLASEALVRARDPALLALSRGVLAATGRALPAAREVARVPCAPSDLWGELALCRGRDEVSVREAGAARWTRALVSAEARLVDGGRVVVAWSPARTEILSAATGATIRGEASVCEAVIGTHLDDGGDGRTALSWNRNCLARIGAEATEVLPAFVCEASGAHAVAGHRDGRRVALACGDGSIRVLDAGSVARFDVGLGTPSRPPLVTALAFVDDDVVLVGAADGRIERVTLRPTITREALASQSGMVRLISLADDHTRALVLAEASAPLVLDLARGAPLLRLPDRPMTTGRFDGAAGLLVALTEPRAGDDPAARVERWDVTGLLPRRLRFPDGVTVVSASRTGGLVGVGDGATLVLLDGERRVVARHRWQESIIKTLGFDDAGTAVAHGQRLMDIRVFDRERPGARYVTPESIWRRVAVLADGTLVGANHRHELFVMRRDAPPVELARTPLVDLVASRDGRDVALLLEGGEVRCGRAFATRRELMPCARDEAGVALALEGDRLYTLQSEAVRAWQLVAAGDAIAGAVHRAPRGELIAIAAGGDLVAAGSRSGRVWIWRAGDPEAHAIVHAHATRVDSLAFAPDARWLVAGGWDGHASFIEPHALEDRRAGIDALLGSSARAGSDMASPVDHHSLTHVQ